MPSKYQELFSDIQQKIQAGSWYGGMLMPTENELCAVYGVSRITVRHALADLEKCGLIERIQGKGSFVSGSRMSSHNTHQGFAQNVFAHHGLTVTSKLLGSELIESNAEVAEKLQLGGEIEDRLVWHFTRLRCVNGEPVALMNAFVRKELGDAMFAYDLETESFYKLYETILKRKITNTRGTVTAVNPSAESCKLLGVEQGSAHIWYKSVGYLEDGAPVEAGYALFNALKYEFSVDLQNIKFSSE